MAIDLKAKAEEIAKKIASDKELQAQFQSQPTQAVEKLLGVDLTDGAVEKLVEAVKAHLAAGKLSDTLSAFKKLF